MIKIGYLGPEGTFSEQAAINYCKNIKDFQLIKFSNIQDVIIAVSKNEISEGIVPFENSTEGTVTVTADTLIFDADVYIKTDLILPVNENIFVKKNYNGEKINKILSHPQAIAQCRNYLHKNFNNIPIENINSTALSAELVSESKEFIAGIGPERAAELFGLKIIGYNIQDENYNATRFIVLTSKKPSENIEHEKTSIIFTTKNKPGELYKILDIFSIWDINLTKIESRPMKNKLGTYMFIVDIESQNFDDVKDALKMIKRKSSFFKNLGSYTSFKG